MLTELQEAVALIGWFSYGEVCIYKIENENNNSATRIGVSDDGKPIWRKKWGSINQRKLEGIKKGISDYFVIINKNISKYDRQIHLWIELKKKKKQLKRKSKRGDKGDYVADNEATKEQLVFTELVRNHIDTEACVCYGADEAIEFINRYVKDEFKNAL